jgi:ABC-type bacteriocin/lantibiotic exporter with double-glycine peptidase domain
MKRVQQQSIKHADCGVACVAMLAGCSYQKAFKAFGFADDRRKFYTLHHHLISALGKLGCAVKRKRFRSWREISGRAIVAVNHRQNGYWHWVAFDGVAILDPKPDNLERKTDLRGLHGEGQYLLIDVSKP